MEVPFGWEMAAARSCFGIEKRSSIRPFQGSDFRPGRLRRPGARLLRSAGLECPLARMVDAESKPLLRSSGLTLYQGRLHARSDCLSPRICEDRANLSLLWAADATRLSGVAARLTDLGRPPGDPLPGRSPL